jgi:hypothetical protein
MVEKTKLSSKSTVVCLSSIQEGDNLRLQSHRYCDSIGSGSANLSQVAELATELDEENGSVLSNEEEIEAIKET